MTSSFRIAGEARESGIHEHGPSIFCSGYVHGFRARPFGPSRNDEPCYVPRGENPWIA